VDIGIANAYISHFLANPQLKKKEWNRRRMLGNIAKHKVAARTINWEMEYCTTTCNIETGGSVATPATENEGDPLDTLGVHRPTPST
jgi:hypothetical protein